MLRSLPYSLGFWFADNNVIQTATVTFTLVGTTCNNSTAVGPNCTNLSTLGSVLTVTPSTQWLYFVSPVVSNSVSSITLTAQGSNGTDSNYLINAGSLFTPFQTMFDESFTGFLTIPSPFPGLWYFAVNNLNTENSNVSFVFTTSPCFPQFIGYLCNQNVTDLTGLTSNGQGLTISQEFDSNGIVLPNFLSLTISSTSTPISFMLQSIDGAPSNATIYLRYGNIPTSTFFDLSFVGNILTVTPLQTGIWYIMIFPADDFFVWFGGCPNNCSGLGVCSNGSSICSCVENVFGVDCRFNYITITETQVLLIVGVVALGAVVLAIIIRVIILVVQRKLRRKTVLLQDHFSQAELDERINIEYLTGGDMTLNNRTSQDKSNKEVKFKEDKKKEEKSDSGSEESKSKSKSENTTQP